ncbi:MAG: nucleotide pyrophosphohydrolase [Rhizobacter sp.]|nr:nucleotide pyrophosphohydrolase [Bacteriovorax sp.]
MNLEKLKTEVDKFASDRDWDQFHSVKNLSMALSVESSELLEIFQWMTEEESNLVKNNPAKLEKVEDEAADIFVYLLRLTGKLNIDLEKAVINKMKKNAEKYPVELSRGNSKKYDEL